jgi:hypothetical protein
VRRQTPEAIIYPHYRPSSPSYHPHDKVYHSGQVHLIYTTTESHFTKARTCHHVTLFTHTETIPSHRITAQNHIPLIIPIFSALHLLPTCLRLPLLQFTRGNIGLGTLPTCDRVLRWVDNPRGSRLGDPYWGSCRNWVGNRLGSHMGGAGGHLGEWLR